MATVILVGAGASLAEAGDRTKKSLRPPLDSTFFQLCAAARLDGGATVRRYMHRQFGIDPFLPGYTMEAIFNFVYSDVFSSPRPPGALDAYWALVRMYSAAIARTTNRLRGVSRRGVGSLLRTIWPSDPDIVFITFNQDLLIEKALEAAVSTNSYADIPWNILTTYQRDFAAYLYPMRGASFRSRGGGPEGEAESLPIYKLHGSLNWAWRAKTREDARNSIARPGRKIYCLTGQRIEGDLELNDEVDDR
jgi:hypothetical protein